MDSEGDSLVEILPASKAPERDRSAGCLYSSRVAFSDFRPGYLAGQFVERSDLGGLTRHILHIMILN